MWYSRVLLCMTGAIRIGCGSFVMEEQHPVLRRRAVSGASRGRTNRKRASEGARTDNMDESGDRPEGSRGRPRLASLTHSGTDELIASMDGYSKVVGDDGVVTDETVLRSIQCPPEGDGAEA